MVRRGRFQPLAANTIENYERALRVHVLEFVSERSGQAVKDLPVDAIDTRTMQAMVRSLDEHRLGRHRARSHGSSSVDASQRRTTRGPATTDAPRRAARQ